jgi:hypothetical protein
MAAPLDEGKPRWCYPRMLAIAAIVGVVIAGLGKRSSLFVDTLRGFDDATTDLAQLNLGATTSRGRGLQRVNPRSGAGPQFVFFAGLEGSGHHIMQAAYRTSPASLVIQALNLTDRLKKLENLLFSPAGIVFEHCRGPQATDTVDDDCRGPRNETREACQLWNAKDLILSIRETLLENDVSQVRVPLNIMSIRASYPDGVGVCRAIKYPSLERLYRVCDYAGVPCRHVYLLRDPLSIERSTVQKRPFNKDEMMALQIHTTMLNVLFTQMYAHSDKLLGCIELLPTTPDSSTIHKYHLKSPAEIVPSNLTTTFPRARDASVPVSTQSHVQFSYEQLVTWFGWRTTLTNALPGEADYKTFLQKSVIRPPSPRLLEEDVVPPELRMHLSSMLRSHDAIVQLCST